MNPQGEEQDKDPRHAGKRIVRPIRTLNCVVHEDK